MKRKKYRGLIYLIYIVILLVLFVGALEILLRKIYHFGDPVLYTSNAVFGYRPEPDQEVVKHTQEVVKINNLGIRANEDWDNGTKNKVLFLGNSVTYGGAVSNHELFSISFTEGIDTLVSGSAGVNGWGVENIHALVVEYGFLPAGTYVTVLIESDFYRGLQRSSLLANHWFVKPKSALHHITGYIMRDFAKNAYIGRGESDVSEKEDQKLKRIIVNNAAEKLKELDDFLKENGYEHYIFISPSREQVYEGAPLDDLVKRNLEQYNISVQYLLDEVKKLKSNNEQNFYKDGIHLNEYGHKVWATLIQKGIFNK